MKNLISIFLMVFLFTIPNIDVVSQNRNVVWVHGLGDDSGAWEHYATIFEAERQINNTRQSYGTSGGLGAAALQLKNSFTNTNATNLGIGHSMGGLMIRDVDRTTGTNDKRFGGFITVASPNYGAPIANSIQNGSVANAIAIAFYRLTAGPLYEPFGIPWTIITGWSTTKVANILNDLVAKFNSASINDLQEGSPVLDLLNNFNSNAQMISIIGEETSPVHWRLASTMLYGAGSSGNPGDQQMASIINNIRGVYNVWVETHEIARIAALAMGNFFGAGYHSTAFNEWKQGRDWLDESETIWCNLIKASRLESYIVGEWIEIPCTNPNCACKLQGPPGPGNHGPMIFWCEQHVYQEVTHWVTVNYGSDGLLPTYAQELKGVDIGSNNRYVINHANHMELLNMSYSKNASGYPNDGTRNTLNEIFSRQPPSWFHTP